MCEIGFHLPSGGDSVDAGCGAPCQTDIGGYTGEELGVLKARVA